MLFANSSSLQMDVVIFVDYLFIDLEKRKALSPSYSSPLHRQHLCRGWSPNVVSMGKSTRLHVQIMGSSLFVRNSFCRHEPYWSTRWSDVGAFKNARQHNTLNLGLHCSVAGEAFFSSNCATFL